MTKLWDMIAISTNLELRIKNIHYFSVHWKLGHNLMKIVNINKQTIELNIGFGLS